MHFGIFAPNLGKRLIKKQSLIPLRIPKWKFEQPIHFDVEQKMVG